jgi:hypothetical protein
MLGRHLPSRYRVGGGFVIDAAGRSSQQTDVILYDRQYTPLLFNHGGQLYVPAESVYAVFEVKQRLGPQEIGDAGVKAASVRRLARTSAQIHDARGLVEEPKDPFRILAGILCTSRSWRRPLRSTLPQALRSLGAEEQLDIGCVAEDAGFEIDWDDARRPKVEISSPDATLVFLFLRLLKKLQSIGTVRAIDLDAYERALE